MNNLEKLLKQKKSIVRLVVALVVFFSLVIGLFLEMQRRGLM